MARKKKWKSPQTSLRDRLEQRAARREKASCADVRPEGPQIRWENLPATLFKPMREHMFEKTVAAIVVVICLGLFSLFNLPLTNRLVDGIHYLTVHQTHPSEWVEAARPVMQNVRDFNWRRGEQVKPPPPDPTNGEQAMAAPVNGVLSSPYGPRTDQSGQTEMHYGIDVLTEADAPVYAAFAGTVSLIKEHPVYGLTIYLEHPDRMVTIYGRVAGVQVAAGDRVARGQKLAAVAAAADGASHLHFEVWKDSLPVNPEDYLIETD
jgi:hypothetical protein